MPSMHYMLPQREGEPASNPAPTILEHRAMQLCVTLGSSLGPYRLPMSSAVEEPLVKRSPTTCVEDDWVPDSLQSQGAVDI